MAALLLLVTAAAAANLGDLARRDTGDIFTLKGSECGVEQCAEHGARAAVRDAITSSGCACACPQRAPLFREDRELCVDDLPECSLATFGTGNGVQRIPFVYLPLKGQIIHPSREITFQNVKTPVCAVSGAQFLTRKGFFDLRNTLDADVPFSLFRDEGRTFLQWSGEDDMRKRMSGRVMVVRLLCRDISATPTSPLDLRGVFTPCVAFRVQGTPPKQSNNITEVQFASNAHTFESSGSSGLTVTEYIVIGISSLLLGLIYVASVFLYLHIKRRRKAAAKNNNLQKLKASKNKDGASLTEHDIIRINNERVQILPGVMNQDEGVIKNNPLLTVGRQFHDNKGFSSDFSDSEDFVDSSLQSEENAFNKQITSVIVHKHSNEIRQQGDGYEINHRDEPSIERLPDEHVSIVETIDDREIARPVGTTRRKLYFNPAYFEPHLMHDPPAAAIEFLSKIREVIAIAKQKMAAKRFHPVLNQIPEEETFPSNGNSINYYNGVGSQRSDSVVSLKRENSRKRQNCLGCPGCKSNRSSDTKNVVKYNVINCSNCLDDKGDKQHSIQKWLENIPNIKQQVFYNDSSEQTQQNTVNSQSPLSNNENKCKLHKNNSFSYNKQLANNILAQRKSTTRSVRSEPSVRNYNIPLPDFNGLESNANQCEIATQVVSTQPVNIREFRSGRLGDSPESIRRNRNAMKNKNALPDMVNEAIALDNFSRSSYNPCSSDEEKLCKNVEPKEEDYSRNISDSPSGNEYETDSLERNSHKKRKTTPIDYPDVPSSQASPSLSSALPLEEELTIRNAIYKPNSSGNSLTPSPERNLSIDDDHYEIIDINKINLQNNTTADLNLKNNNSYSLVSEVYVNNSYNFDSTPTSPSGSECSMGSRKLIALDNIEEKPGCLTIEVKDPPENYIKIHESDGFEPDTLDRKHPKHKEIIESIQFSRRELLQNIDNTEHKSQRIQLRSSGTFAKTNNKIESTNKFNSLRNDYEYQKQHLNRPKLSSDIYSGSKSLEETMDDNWDDNNGWSSEDGRLLTLELRHSKRQRQITPPTIKQLKHLARPDILPPLPPTEDNSVYEKPANSPRRVQSDNISTEKLNNCRSISPRKFKTNTIESDICGTFSLCSTASVPSCSPIRETRHSQYAEYEDVNIIRNCIRTSSCRSSRINTNTFTRGQKNEHRTKFRRKKGLNIEDSGYLSSDSTSSKQVQRKLVIAKIASCSESDGTEDEARSESGAESVETHSVYFGNCQKQQNDERRAEKSSAKLSSDSKRNMKVKSECNSQ
ncbi:unnamed protein product [Euphydryas editha]|uniref:Shavenoid isoform B-like N-terminal domain-containing protein n=1 Tax=Euphydryas editha TaxID=104508 RepID=A0AAU9TUG9_EUPED|nr:unnamed protein product [Euphydryas editha]